MKIKLLVTILLIVVATSGVVVYQNKERLLPIKTCKGCNIMLIDIDILRADALPCFGYSRNTAPNICAFARKSVLFKDNYSTSNWTLPSIFSTITSFYPTFHRMRTMYVGKLSSNVSTMAEVFKKEGYKTVFVGDGGDNGLLRPENGGLRGYDLITTNPIEQVIDDLSKDSKPWFVHYYRGDLHMPYLIPENEKPMENIAAPKKLPKTRTDYDRLLNVYLKKHYTEVFKKKVIDEYGSIILGQDKSNDTNTTELLNKLSNLPNLDKYFIDINKPQFNTYMESFDQNNFSEVAYVRMMYDTTINLLDKKMKILLKKLESKSLINNTITVITSDHGEAFGEHGTFTHVSNYHTELFYTPLIIRAPQLAEKQIEQPTSNIDIFPTLLELVGIKKIPELQGKSLIPYINNEETTPDRFILSECGSGLILQNKNWLYFLPKENPKIEQSELYDKISDQAEENNVARQHLELTQSLYKQISLLTYYENIFNKTKKMPDPNEMKLDPEKIKRMQKEGYF